MPRLNADVIGPTTSANALSASGHLRLAELTASPAIFVMLRKRKWRIDVPFPFWSEVRSAAARRRYERFDLNIHRRL